MKKLIIFLITCIACATVQAQYTDTVSFSKKDIRLTKENGYDRIHFKNAQTTDQVGAPELPVVTKSYVLPYQAEVSSVVINQTDTNFSKVPKLWKSYKHTNPLTL